MRRTQFSIFWWWLVCLALTQRVDEARASGNWERDEDEIVSVTVVEAVVGQNASLPCDITPPDRNDRSQLVLWFRDTLIKPIYSFDVRGRVIEKAKNLSDHNVIGPRASFVATSIPHASLLLEGVQLGDEGVYRCRVDFLNSPTRNFQVNLTVIVQPNQLKIFDDFGKEANHTVGPYEVDTKFVLRCEVRGGKPTPTVWWLMNDRKIVGESKGTSHADIVVNKLVLESLKRNHLNNTFKCVAENTNKTRPLSKAVKLNLKLKPVIVKILKKPPVMEAEKNYSITCEVEGSHPRAEIHWLESNNPFRQTQMSHVKVKDSGVSRVQSTLTFFPLPEDHGKVLKCLGKNPEISSFALEDSFHMNVVFPPKVHLQLGSTLRAENIKEGDDVYFECKVRANPEHHKIIWKHNGGTLIQNHSAGIIMSTQSLVLQRIGRDNAGNYTCVASNDRGETMSPIIFLRVQFAPICKSKQMTVIGASLEESIKVRCEVVADPNEVDFYWEFNNSGENFETPARVDDSNGTLSEIIYTPISERDYGALSCWGRNAIGKQLTVCVYQIIPAVRPSPLTNCTIKAVINQTSETLEIECAPGYDGGLAQEFRLEVYEVDSGKLRLNVSSQQLDQPAFRIQIDELLPATHFYLQAYAANTKGKSDPFIVEDVMLRDSDKRRDASTSIVPLVMMLVGCSLALAVTLVSAVLMMYRRRGSTSPVHIEPYMKQPIITPPDSRNNSMLDVAHGDHTYFVEYTLKQVKEYALNNQPDIIQSPQVDPEKLKREPQLFLPVRPDTLFAPYDMHKQGLQTNRCSLNPFTAKSWEPISFKADRNLMKEIIIANSIPGPESCV